MSTPPLPASDTKHITVLSYPFLSHKFELQQKSDHGLTNGTSLWPGGQVLSLFFAYHLRLPHGGGRRPKAIELGSGIGLTSLALCTLGWDVLATDTKLVVSSVLSNNIEANRPSLPASSGIIQTRVLDWKVPVSQWTWHDQDVIASNDVPASAGRQISEDNLKPPFDLIITADTIYSPELIGPLLGCLHHLTILSTSVISSRSPPIYVCVERRDPQLLNMAIQEAQSVWGFGVERIRDAKIKKALRKGGVTWNHSDWDGVEIWKFIRTVSKQ